MGWREICLEQIPQDEQSGRHARFPYLCPAGAQTIGWGRNIDPLKGGKGLTRAEADFMLEGDVDECAADLQTIFPRWAGINDVRKAALVNVRFQVGPGAFRKFVKMIAAVNADDWKEAASQLLDSALAKQARERTYRRANELERG